MKSPSRIKNIQSRQLLPTCQNKKKTHRKKNIHLLVMDFITSTQTDNKKKDGRVKCNTQPRTILPKNNTV